MSTSALPHAWLRFRKWDETADLRHNQFILRAVNPDTDSSTNACRNRRNEMKYMLLVYSDEQAWTESAREHCYTESTQLTHQLKSSGNYLGANPLCPVATATSVRMRDGKRLVTDGPFAETREQLGGYFMIDAKDLDEAIGIAARIPGARVGTIEIR